MTTVDGGGMVGDLLIAFVRIGCPQFVEAFEVVLMEDVPCRTGDSPVGNRGSFRSVQVGCGYRRVRPVRRISAPREYDHPPWSSEVPRRLSGPPLVPSGMLILPYCSASRFKRGKSTRMAPRKRMPELSEGCGTRLLGCAKRIYDPLYMFAVLVLRHRTTNTGALHSQRLTRARHFHIRITAKRGHGPTHANRFCAVVMANITLFNLLAQTFGSQTKKAHLPVSLFR